MTIISMRVFGAAFVAASFAVFVLGTQARPLGVTVFRLALFSIAFCLWMLGLAILAKASRNSRVSRGQGFVGLLLLGSSIAPFVIALVLLYLPQVHIVWVLTACVASIATLITGIVLLVTAKPLPLV